MLLLFDIGGTKTRVALSRDGSSFEDPQTFQTPKTFEEGMKIFQQTAEATAGGEKIEAAAGGINGPLNKRKSRLVEDVNLPDWVDKPLKERLEKIVGAPVFLENDSALAALGEATHGAGRGANIVVYITVSTGVGGSRVVRGRIDERSVGFEPGHQFIPGPEEAGDLEQQVSGGALKKQTGKEPAEVQSKAVWDELARKLAYGLNNTIVHWSPDVVVLGGSMMVKKPGISIERVREYLREILTIFPELPEIKEAELKGLGGLWGALELLKQR